MADLSAARTLVVDNAIVRHYAVLQGLLRAQVGDRDGAKHFCPGWELPPLSAEMVDFFSPSSMAVHHLHGPGTQKLRRHAGHRLALLDMMRNPATRTTKSLASLLMVARAVQYVRRSGRRVMLLTPSSGNKATALRDAVLRAIDLELVAADRLHITSLIPVGSAGKVWSSRLSTDSDLRKRNPVVLYPGREPSDVRDVCRQVHALIAAELRDGAQVDVWYTTDVDNYRSADALRAMVEYEVHPPPSDRGRLHIQAVSSAYGLLGHQLGYQSRTHPGHGRAPRYFLVQQLGAPDMVLDLLRGSAAEEVLPSYGYDPGSGLYRQDTDPRFPATAFDPAERVDATFYARRPPTAAAMTEVIRRQGGGGIVVSLHECMIRYGQVRDLLAPAIELPSDPRDLREWALVMVMTGLLNALDRGLITDDDVLVHGTGCYSADDFRPITGLAPCSQPEELRRLIIDAALPSS
ncbi:DUF6002 family protein [Actinomadura fulvescens]|uniref:Uncharacterized protein n=1 Tax=Actinomadura fulvescens TaxID=46160 RepID=A0ABP6D9S2_9ACTN